MHTDFFLLLHFRYYGTQQSLSACDKERLSSSFEDSNDAKLRQEKQQQQEKGGKRKPKNHCGSFENMTWDKEGLKAEIESYLDDKQINWSELARQFNVKDSKGEITKNEGQIIKDWLLLSQGVYIDRFKLQKRKNETVNSGKRRKKLKILGGDISVPCHQSAIKAMEQLKKDIDSGVHIILVNL